MTKDAYLGAAAVAGALEVLGQIDVVPSIFRHGNPKNIRLSSH